MTADTPRDTVNVAHLREHGPTASGDLPRGKGGKVSIGDRQRGVWKFGPKGGSTGQSASSGGQLTPVYYLDGEPGHGPERVIEAWVAANAYNIGHAPRRGIYQRMMAAARDETWKAAIREVFPLHPTDADLDDAAGSDALAADGGCDE